MKNEKLYCLNCKGKYSEETAIYKQGQQRIKICCPYCRSNNNATSFNNG